MITIFQKQELMTLKIMIFLFKIVVQYLISMKKEDYYLKYHKKILILV